MFSLIVTIIAIALVAVLAVATIYYGGDILVSQKAKANAATLDAQTQQIFAASQAYYLDNSAWPANVAVLSVDGKYLKTSPVPPGSAYAALPPGLLTAAYADGAVTGALPELTQQQKAIYLESDSALMTDFRVEAADAAVLRAQLVKLDGLTDANGANLATRALQLMQREIAVQVSGKPSLLDYTWPAAAAQNPRTRYLWIPAKVNKETCRAVNVQWRQTVLIPDGYSAANGTVQCFGDDTAGYSYFWLSPGADPAQIVLPGQPSGGGGEPSCLTGTHAGGGACLCDGTNAPPLTNGTCAPPGPTCTTGMHAQGPTCVCDGTNAPVWLDGSCPVKAACAESEVSTPSGECLVSKTATLGTSAVYWDWLGATSVAGGNTIEPTIPDPEISLIPVGVQIRNYFPEGNLFMVPNQFLYGGAMPGTWLIDDRFSGNPMFAWYSWSNGFVNGVRTEVTPLSMRGSGASATIAVRMIAGSPRIAYSYAPIDGLCGAGITLSDGGCLAVGMEYLYGREYKLPVAGVCTEGFALKTVVADPVRNNGLFDTWISNALPDAGITWGSPTSQVALCFSNVVQMEPQSVIIPMGVTPWLQKIDLRGEPTRWAGPVVIASGLVADGSKVYVCRYSEGGLLDNSLGARECVPAPLVRAGSGIQINLSSYPLRPTESKIRVVVMHPLAVGSPADVSENVGGEGPDSAWGGEGAASAWISLTPWSSCWLATGADPVEVPHLSSALVWNAVHPAYGVCRFTTATCEDGLMVGTSFSAATCVGTSYSDENPPEPPLTGWGSWYPVANLGVGGGATCLDVGLSSLECQDTGPVNPATGAMLPGINDGWQRVNCSLVEYGNGCAW
jgi:type II secretory pathway pseudopilin PulG